MPAAAQMPGHGAGVHRTGGADADFVAAVLLLAQGQAHLHPFDGAGQAGQVLQLGPGHAGGDDLVPGEVDHGAAAVEEVFEAFQRHPLDLDAGAGTGFEQPGVEHLQVGPGFDQAGRRLMGVGGGAGKAEAAGVGGDAGVQAGRDGGVQGDAHLLDHVDHELTGRGGAGVQQRFVGIAAVAGMVVDAQVHMGRVFLHIVAVAEQLDAGHVHRHHETGGEAGVVQAQLHIPVQAGDRVAAENGRVFPQRLQRQVQRTCASDGVTVRVLVAQDQDILGRAEPHDGCLPVHRFCHN